jgi:hypothetical protein
MTNYTKATNFATKDALSSGNPLKIVKGTEIDTEFNNIATAIATKADLASPTFTGTPTLPTGTIAVTQSAGSNTTTIATTAFVQTALATLYPVGSIYINATSSTNPATLLGFGTWTAFGAGRVMFVVQMQLLLAILTLQLLLILDIHILVMLLALLVVVVV